MAATLLWCLGSPFAQAGRYIPDPDRDVDDVPEWEASPVWDGDGEAPPSGPETTNSDYDTLPDWYEDYIGTDKTNPDTDGDWLLDSDEVTLFGTNPLLLDSDGNSWPDYYDVHNLTGPDGDADGDQLSNQDELAYGTDVLSSDTDGDGLDDGLEAASGGAYSPTSTDTDGNGYGDYDEYYGYVSYNDTTDGSGSGTENGTDDGTAAGDSNPTATDGDGDGLDAVLEAILGTSDGSTDSDGDGLPDYDEYTSFGTNPASNDTDGDGLLDDIEYNSGGTYSPTNPDTDYDGEGDYSEYWNLASPTELPDTDGDGIDDYSEANYNTDYQDADTDDDGLEDGSELQIGTDPTNPDSDGDLLTDYAELQWGTQPIEPDTDSDTLYDGQEVTVIGSDPLQQDTDGDGLADDHEVNLSATDPTKVDTDGDFLTDYEEVNASDIFGADIGVLDPNAVDSDGDQKPDYLEVSSLLIDADGAGIPDRIEEFYGLNPLSAADELGDLDGDGWKNLSEYLAGYGLNSDFASTYDWDADGMSNVWEVHYGLNPTNATDAAEDPDNDYVFNLEEYRGLSNPKVADSDSNYYSNPMPDQTVLYIIPGELQWNGDWDQDGISNWSELMEAGSDPRVGVPINDPGDPGTNSGPDTGGGTYTGGGTNPGTGTGICGCSYVGAGCTCATADNCAGDCQVPGGVLEPGSGTLDPTAPSQPPATGCECGANYCGCVVGNVCTDPRQCGACPCLGEDCVCFAIGDCDEHCGSVAYECPDPVSCTCSLGDPCDGWDDDEIASRWEHIEISVVEVKYYLYEEESLSDPTKSVTDILREPQNSGDLEAHLEDGWELEGSETIDPFDQASKASEFAGFGEGPWTEGAALDIRYRKTLIGRDIESYRLRRFLKSTSACGCYPFLPDE